MKKSIYAFLLYSALPFSSAHALIISPEPITIYYTPDSIIHHTPENYLQYVGARTRFSTCTGVAWFLDSQHLVSANLLESSLQTYKFKPSKKKIYKRKKFNKKTTLLGWPENLATNKDASMLAISNSYSGKLNIYRMYSSNSTINPSPMTQIEAGDQGLHGVRFSPDGKYLGYVTYDGLGKIRLFKISKTGNNIPLFDLCCSVDSHFENLAPKGLDFSPDLKYIAICYSSKGRAGISEVSGKLAIFSFDAENGIIDPNPISEINTEEYLNEPEDVLFFSDNSHLIVSNQGNDTVTVHTFDQETGYLQYSYIALESPKAQLNFPHGISISPDGKYFAVSNYGDDKICIYTID